MAITRLLKSPALQQAWEEQSSTGFRGTESNGAQITAPCAGVLSREADWEQAQRLPPPRELVAWGAGTRPQHGAGDERGRGWLGRTGVQVPQLCPEPSEQPRAWPPCLHPLVVGNQQTKGSF